MKYADKKAVVVGGTHGMGLAVATALRDGGAKVLVTGSNADNVETARATLGQSVVVIRSDVARVGDIDTLAATVETKLGKIDLLHVNAGFARLEPMAEVTEASFDRTFAINTRGAFFTVQRLAPHVTDGGAIVFTSSIADASGTAGMSVYGASKAAVRSLARTFAAELVARRIRVNVVSPGFVHTPTLGVVEASAEEREAFMRIGDEITPMKRAGTVDEVARAVLFLGFDATFTTGARLTVDGGLGQDLSLPAS